MKSKILIANSYIPWGGLGQYSINLAQIFKNAGYDVYGLVTHSKNELFNEFAELTIETVYFGDRNLFVKYFSILNFVRRIKPDFIFANYLPPIQFLLPLLEKSKIISVIHSDLPDFYRSANINHWFVDQWIAPTPRIKEGFFQYTGNHKILDRTSIILHGITKSTRTDRELNQGIFNIIFVGALYEHKGVDLLPEIFSSFHHACPNSHLTIIGGGIMELFLIEEFTIRGLNDHVTFTGVIPNLEVRGYYGISDVLLFPTRVEGFGLVIAEAMMEGTVPLTTLLPGITDAIVEAGFTGLLVEKNNINEFVHSLRQLYNSRSLLNQMSRAAMKDARERFGVEIMEKNYIKMLNSI